MITSRLSAIPSFLRDSWNHFVALRPTRMAASLSYYGLFSLVPILVITSWIGSAAFDNSALSSEILERVSSVIGPESAAFLQTTFANASSLGNHSAREMVAVAALIALAVAGMAELKNSLDDIWQTPYRRPRTAVAWVLRYLVPSLATVLFGIVFALFVVVSKFVQAGFTFGIAQETLSIARTFGAPLAIFLVTTAGTFVAYTVLPERQIPVGNTLVGAAVTGLFLAVGNVALGFYLAHAATVSTYGVAGSIVAVLLWFYYSSLMFLFGASATWTYHLRSAESS